MPQITLLSQETIDKIAAGEVIERPSSVVKELVENAIDAKATAVTVEIKEGGISLIRITDNGCGIAREQVPLAFLRHSTSKIQSIEDLFHVSSLGFRGEALSSIAAVSQVELITKTYGELTGTRYVIEGSKEKENEEVGAPDGTTFLVRNLFYNIPARRKFLKSAQTEGNYVGDLMERLALSHPDISFKFISNGQTKLHTSGNSKEKDMIYHIYGRDITASVLPIHAEHELFTVHGFLGKPVISRGNRNYESYFINGRYIKSALLSKAIEDGYKGFLMQHQYPFCVLYFTVDQELLDVNVHPTKMELRFANKEEIYSSLCQIVRDALTHREFIPEVSIGEKKEAQRAPIASHTPEPFEKSQLQKLRASVAKDSPYELKYPDRDRLLAERAEEGAAATLQERTQQDSENSEKKQDTDATIQQMGQAENLAVFEKLLGDLGGQEQNAQDNILCEAGSYQTDEASRTKDAHGEACGLKDENKQEAAAEKATQETIVYEQQTLAEQSKEFLTKDAAKCHRIIGQVFGTYWLIEYEDKLFIIDQHAAHEKVLYERTMARVQAQDFSSQAISPPIILTLDLREQEILQRYGSHLEQFGYEIAAFGGKEYAINAVPAEFGSVDAKSMFLELLDSFANTSGREAPEQILEKVASLSCKAAVKGGSHLSVTEAERLIDELLTIENPYHCPHGRPTIISMSRYELEKKFKRIV